MENTKMTDAAFEQFQKENKILLEDAQEKSKETMRNIQIKMVQSPQMESIPFEVRQQLGSRGLFLVGLSFLKTADVLLLTHLMSDHDFKMYQHLEKKVLKLRSDQLLNGMKIIISNAKKNQSAHVQMTVPFSSFEEVNEYALNSGYHFCVTPQALSLAKKVKESAELYELLTINLSDKQLKTQDGLPSSDWYVHNDYLTTEYVCLKSMILLRNHLEDKGSTMLNDLLYALVFNRIQTDVLMISDYIEHNGQSKEEIISGLVYCRALFDVVKEPCIYDMTQRQAVLYHAIAETGKCLGESSKECPEWGAYLNRWLDGQTKTVISKMPQQIRQSKIADRIIPNKGNENENV